MPIYFIHAPNSISHFTILGKSDLRFLLPFFALMSGTIWTISVDKLEEKRQVTIVNGSTDIDPFSKQAWIEYGRRFCIYSVTGLAVGAACAFVLMGTSTDWIWFVGKPTYRAASMALGLGCGIGSAWTRSNIDIHNRRMAKKYRKEYRNQWNVSFTLFCLLVSNWP